MSGQMFPQHLQSQLFPTELRLDHDREDDFFAPSTNSQQQLQQHNSFPDEVPDWRQPRARQQNRFEVLAGEEFEDPVEAALRHKVVSHKAAGNNKRWPGWPGENVFRLVVPAHKAGVIIGHKGELVRKICIDSKAKVKILEGVLGATERIVMVSGKEEPDARLSPAMDALLKVHKRLLDDGIESGEMAPFTSRLLVPAAQAGCLIGRQGSTVKSIYEASHATVRVLPEENVPLYALQDDKVVEIYGDPDKVHHAMKLVIGHLRKFLVDRSVLPLFENNRFKAENAQQTVAPTPTAHPPPPTRAPGSALSQVKVKQVLRMPLSYSDAIIGTSGANISYMRRTSGASITLQDLGNELCVEVEGNNKQVHQAQQLIENFVQQYIP